ncbi:glycine-rich domain-containing protein [Portibacter marinus]|uniref:glycine-rich domain-containing protein n=1 Tax=Portibacter marinus TaxID=2898660 RepID=UPI001F204071|nr:hypothetical protein [Portibacter marinus]
MPSNMLRKLILLSLIILLFASVNAQNVGIGTTSPDEKLTVVGTVKATTNSNGNSPQLNIHEADSEFGRIMFTNDASSQNFTLAGNPHPDSSLARFHIFKSNFGNIGSFTGHGRFGVNTSNPGATFQLNSLPDTDPLNLRNQGQTKLRIFDNNAMVFGSSWSSPIPDVIRMETPNVFIGFDENHLPEDRLEVDGNIKITGGITAGNTSGSPGQILTTNTNGNISWADPCKYNRFLSFSIAGISTWKVPVGVTEIMVEIWGAGGGGALGGGGGSGGYAKAVFSVTEGDVMNIATGAGGSGVSSGATQSASPGGNTIISGPSVYAAASGGGGATAMTFGERGIYAVDPPFLSASVLPGSNGYANVTIPIYSGVSKETMGNGGNSPNSSPNGGKGDVVILQGTSMTHNQGSNGLSPGGGGGGGNQFSNNGGDGLVVIRWNEY